MRGGAEPALLRKTCGQGPLPQDAAEYMRLNVLPRPGQAQPPPQIIAQ